MLVSSIPLSCIRKIRNKSEKYVTEIECITCTMILIKSLRSIQPIIAIVYVHFLNSTLIPGVSL